MAATTAYCTSNTSFHQHPIAITRSQFSPTSRRTSSAPSTSFSPSTSVPHFEYQTTIRTIKSDENNNNDHQLPNTETPSEDSNDVLYITSDVDDDDNDDDDNIVNSDPEENSTDVEHLLSLVGLRSKTRKSVARKLTVRPLTKRLAVPVCLLPLPKYRERVRQALYTLIPSLKFLSSTHDFESFCTTDENAKAQSLLPRSSVKTRASLTYRRTPRKDKLPKTDLINMATNTFRNNTSKPSADTYPHSILQCHVALDRLEQSTINQIVKKSIEDESKYVARTSTFDLCPSSPEVSPKTHRSRLTDSDETTTTTTRTVITTMTTEKTVVKRKSTTELVKPKRLKITKNNCSIVEETKRKSDPSLLDYQRIYLKCFLCSKREYINAQNTHSDVLQSHWREHGRDVSMNIYDSEIDSVLTRVVEFFNLPKQHTLEGQIKAVFVQNSDEVSCVPPTSSPSDS